MKQVVQDVLKKLDLDYTVTLISRGETGRCEIVMWDRPLNSYFSLRLRWSEEITAATLEKEIEGQLKSRLQAVSSGKWADRRPRYHQPRPLASRRRNLEQGVR